MASTPQQNLPDEFVAGRACAICGAPALRVAHLKSFPDYVACGSCKASFVAEAEGGRVLYGNIPESFPATRAAALRKWSTLPEVEAVAIGERPRPSPPRPAAVPVPSEPVVDPDASLRAAALAAVPIPTEPEVERPPLRGVLLQPEEEIEVEEERAVAEEEDASSAEPPLGRLSRLMAGAPESEPVDDWAHSLVPDRKPAEAPTPPAAPPSAAPTGAIAAATQAAGKPTAAPGAASRPAAAPAGDPPPGQRYRVAVNNDQVVFPMHACAHCMTSPAPKRLTILGTAPQGQAVGGRKSLRYTIPLCPSCYRRAAARTVEEKNARLNAQLISVLVALALLVITLAIPGLIDLQANLGLAAVLMLIVLGIGYALPSMILLGRANRYPPGPDARYIRSTLLIPEASQGLETAFEWRNQRYAEEFHQANRQRALAGVVAVKDRAQTA